VQPAVEHLDVLPAEREDLAAPERRTERERRQTPRESPPFGLCGLSGTLRDSVGVQDRGDLLLA